MTYATVEDRQRAGGNYLLRAMNCDPPGQLTHRMEPPEFWVKQFLSKDRYAQFKPDSRWLEDYLRRMFSFAYEVDTIQIYGGAELAR